MSGKITLILLVLACHWTIAPGQRNSPVYVDGQKVKSLPVNSPSDSLAKILPDTSYIHNKKIPREPSFIPRDTNSVLKKVTDSIPEPIGYINDFENILSGNEELILDSIVKRFEKQTTIEIAIVTLDSSHTTTAEFDRLTFNIFNTWGVGKKDKNNGILIGISRSLRMMRIYNGYGIEKTLSDVETKKIIDNIFIPQFKNGNYFEGTRQGLLAIMDHLR